MTNSITPPSANDEDFTIDIGGLTMASSTMASSPYWASSGNISIANITAAGTGYNYANGSVLTIGGSNGGVGGPGVYTVGASNWNSTQPSLKVSGDADFEGDVKIGGKSIVALLQKIEDRLAILQPDPKRLAKYEALQEAYEHYKVLEALCVEDNVDPTKK